MTHTIHQFGSTKATRTLHLEALEDRAVPATGQLLLQSFNDLNQNGAWDTGEAGVSGATIGYYRPSSNVGPAGTGNVTTGSGGTGLAVIEEQSYSFGASSPAGYAIAIGYGAGTFDISAGLTTTLRLPLHATTGGSGSGLFANDDTATVVQGGSVTINVLANDIGYSNGPVIVATPQNGTVQVVGSQIVYTPAVGYNGYETFSYAISDGVNTAEAAIGVLTQVATNTSLQAGGDSAFTTVNTAITMPVLDNDVNYVGGIVSMGQPAHGNVSIVGNKILFTPTPGYIGSDTFSYTVIGGQGNYATAQVSVDIQQVAVDVDINSTTSVTDDVGIVGQTIPVKVTMHAPGSTGPQSVQLRLSNSSSTGGYVASSRAVFASNSSTILDLTLADGQTTIVNVRPTTTSDNPNDILVQAYFYPLLNQGNPPKVGEKPMEVIMPLIGSYHDGREVPHRITAVTTTLLQVNRLQYRIPPRRDTAFWVTLGGAVAPQRVINVYVVGNSAANGKAEIKVIGTPWAGADILALRGNQFNARDRWDGLIRGLVQGGQVFQTEIGSAGNLGMGVTVDAVPATRTTLLHVGFSVASNPTSIRITGASKEQVVETGLGGTDSYQFAWGAKHDVQVVSAIRGKRRTWTR